MTVMSNQENSELQIFSILCKSDKKIDSSSRSSAYMNALKHVFRILQSKPDLSSLTNTSSIKTVNIVPTVFSQNMNE